MPKGPSSAVKPRLWLRPSPKRAESQLTALCPAPCLPGPVSLRARPLTLSSHCPPPGVLPHLKKPRKPRRYWTVTTTTSP